MSTDRRADIWLEGNLAKPVGRSKSAISISRKMNVLVCDSFLCLSITFMNNFREMTFFAD